MKRLLAILAAALLTAFVALFLLFHVSNVAYAYYDNDSTDMVIHQVPAGRLGYESSAKNALTTHLTATLSELRGMLNDLPVHHNQVTVSRLERWMQLFKGDLTRLTHNAYSQKSSDLSNLPNLARQFWQFVTKLTNRH